MLDDYFFSITWRALEIFSMKKQDIKYIVYNECQLFQILQDNFNDEFDDLMTFDDITTCNDRWKKDKYSSFREVFEMFNKQCTRNYSPDEFFIIDEKLYPAGGSIVFNTQNKDKPAKIGSNLRILRSARKSYAFYTTPY